MEKVLVLQSLDTFHGEPPKAAIAITKDATLSGSAATIDVSNLLADGQEVLYALLKKATVTSGDVSVAAAVPGATAEVTVLMIVPAPALNHPEIP